MSRTGALGPIEGPATVRRDTNGFVSTERTWTGFLDELNALASTLTGEWTISQMSGPVYKLTSTDNGNTTGGGGVGSTNPEEQVVTVWDLKVSQHRRDLWELPVIAAELRKLTSASDRAKLLNQVRDFGRGEPEFQSLNESNNKVEVIKLTEKAILDFAVARGLRFDVMVAFIGEISRGVDSFLHNTFALSKKRVGPAAASSLSVQFELVNRALSTSTLLAREPSIPAAIASPIRSQLQSGAWIRQSDELNQLDASRVEINSQWIWAQDYSTLIYGLPE